MLALGAALTLPSAPPFSPVCILQVDAWEHDGHVPGVQVQLHLVQTSMPPARASTFGSVHVGSAAKPSEAP